MHKKILRMTQRSYFGKARVVPSIGSEWVVVRMPQALEIIVEGVAVSLSSRLSEGRGLARILHWYSMAIINMLNNHDFRA